MLQTITPAEMKRVETRAMDMGLVTGEALMHGAAAQVAARVQALRNGGKVLCLCGTGNNGGDGLAAMRILAQSDDAFCGECLLLNGTLSSDARRELDALMRAAAGRVSVRRLESDTLPELPRDMTCVIDALFGTGLSRPLSGAALALCEWVNALCNVPVVAVDIPSGLNGETGQVMGAAVCATETVTFHRPKAGLYLGQGPDHTGVVTIADIGLPARADDACGCAVLEESDLSAVLKPRKRVSHKGSYGRVLLWAGSRGMAGAAAVCATAALRTGAGLATVACPDTILDIVQTLCPCATCVPLPMEDADAAWTLLEGALSCADALGAGCGLGQSAVAAELFERLLAWLNAHALPAVLDADALNLLAKRPAHLAGTAAHLLTPHPAEAARLLGVSTAQVTADALRAAHSLSQRYGAAVALKGASSVLCDGKNTAISPFGTPAMAKGGSGDALTGVMAALLAGRAAGTYAMNDLTLMQTACALHGLAGRAAEERFGERGVLATDLCMFLGKDFSEQTVQASSKALNQAVSVQTQAPNAGAPSPLGKHVTVTVEHKLGSHDGKDETHAYALNCGFVQEVLDTDNDWQDACIYGVQKPLEWFEGVVVARLFLAAGTVWVVADEETRPTLQEVRRATAFLGQARTIEMR